MDVLTTSVDIVATLLAALVLAPACAHVLERPGKARLSCSDYFTVQQIYVPGFTRAGAATEVPGILVTAIDAGLASGDREAAARAVALTALVGVQVAYWVIVHPVNKIWVRGMSLDPAASRFFSAGGRDSDTGDAESQWHWLRDRWDRGHAVRAALAFAALLALLLGRG
jgi:hypothetical protein